jgi:GH24 family phage-related lysozyme (muramidase)
MRGIQHHLAREAKSIVQRLTFETIGHDESIRAACRFLIDHEGIVLGNYKDQAGHETFGIGHKRQTTYESVPTTIDESVYVLQADVLNVWTRLKEYEGVLSTCRMAALLSFVFNIGVGRFNSESCSVRKHIETGAASRINLVPTSMMLYVKVRDPLTGEKKYSGGLHQRRLAEVNLWRSVTWEHYSDTRLIG